MLALMIMYSKTPARYKVRKLFDMLDLDGDDNLNYAETILMLRYGVVGVLYITRQASSIPFFQFRPSRISINARLAFSPQCRDLPV